jgi:glycosyltransferase involved in cell wall biosynthesis
MKIAFAGRWSPLDKKSWSGTYHYTYHQLKQRHHVEYFYFKWSYFIREWLLLRRQYGKLILKQQVAVEFLKDYSKYFSNQLNYALKGKDIDALFIPAAPQLLAYLNTSIPAVFLTDATFQQIQGYYHSFKNIAPFNLREGIAIDSLAFSKAARCLLASDWCKASAITDYGIEPECITVAPFGANLDIIPDIKDICLTQEDEICRLLFLGVEWERKGGQIAYDAFKALQKKGVHCQLTIIGCIPPIEIKEKEVTIIPFLNKHDANESAQLYQYLKNASFLLLPTRAEAAGIVFCEAAAYGIPSIATQTGGVATYVHDNENGFLLNTEATGSAYADIIYRVFSDKQQYNQLRKKSRNRFDTVLNWNVWGNSFDKILAEILR